MPQRKSKDEFVQQASMSQRLAHMYPEYSEYAGTDEKLSVSIAILNVMNKHRILDFKQPTMKLIMDILNEKRKAKFATSERTNEITKMGMQMPSSVESYEHDE